MHRALIVLPLIALGTFASAETPPVVDAFQAQAAAKRAGRARHTCDTPCLRYPNAGRLALEPAEREALAARFAAVDLERASTDLVEELQLAVRERTDAPCHEMSVDVEWELVAGKSGADVEGAWERAVPNARKREQPEAARPRPLTPAQRALLETVFRERPDILASTVLLRDALYATWRPVTVRRMDAAAQKLLANAKRGGKLPESFDAGLDGWSEPISYRIEGGLAVLVSSAGHRVDNHPDALVFEVDPAKGLVRTRAFAAATCRAASLDAAERARVLADPFLLLGATKARPEFGPDGARLRILGVPEGSLTAKAGLCEGDLVVTVDGQRFSPESFIGARTTLTLGVERGGEARTIVVGATTP